MKSTVISHSALKSIALATATFVLVAGFSLNSFANTIKETGKNANNNGTLSFVKYVFTGEKSADFHVEFDNPTGEKFRLNIFNDEGEIVFSREYSETHFSKTVKIMTEGIDNHQIRPTFTISAGSKLIQRSFAVESTDANGSLSAK